MNTKKTVYVGLSGGVDSSVSAALLKQQGYDVHGVFIQTWSPEWMHCTWQDERRDAMRVAIHLGIPFHDLDLSEVYRKNVAEFFIAEYAAGRTPNPDVLCNRHVKFGAMWEWARQRGADFVATGHYAMVVNSETQQTLQSSTTSKSSIFQNLRDASALAAQGMSSIFPSAIFAGSSKSNAVPAHAESATFACSKTGDVVPVRAESTTVTTSQLHAGPDKSKDQSYFLWTLTSADLDHILFPIGHLPKTRVRELAREFAIPVATKKDSQGICFLGQVDMAEFLGHYIDLTPGDVLDIHGTVIGSHEGALTFTLGQRHGFTLFKSSPTPLYVIAKDVENNTITVGPESLLVSEEYSDEHIRLGSVVWRDESVVVGDTLWGAIRYHGQLQEFRVTEVGTAGEPVGLARRTPDATITAGQSIVFYRDGLCQGGGVIQ